LITTPQSKQLHFVEKWKKYLVDSVCILQFGLA